LARSGGFSRTRRLVGSPRKTGWEDGPNTSTLTITANGSTLWTAGQVAAFDALTIVRMRGMLECHVATAASNGDGFQSVAVGIGKVANAAFVAGVASVPTPLSEGEWEGWLYHQHLGAMLGITTSPTFNNAGSGQIRQVIDSKAMRKIGSEEVIYGCIEVSGEIGAATLIFHANTRMLVKLP